MAKAKPKSKIKSKKSSVVSASPFGSGCLSLFITFLILAAVISVIKL